MRKFFHNCWRVLRVAKKPDKNEYLQVAKVTGLGILLVGFVGFMVMFLGSIIQEIFASI
ncbi:MAG: protein translocase SEC61 complex subunit gamma [Candidatus Hodarchaeaceae archaeon]|nr:protein translocase SEC61 complex subunit gamma [Candidatus Hodarchaeaceae archaeon]MDI6884361.1 protein translocase SEC61 complex subunit gamma [Hadesarchaea archaeon]